MMKHFVSSRPTWWAACCLMFAGLSATIQADDHEFALLFNEKDLTGWVNVNCAPNTFTARDGMIAGWLPTELAYRIAWMVLAWLYLLYFTARVWRDEEAG